MKAQKWEVGESIELTQWIKRFSKYKKSLPLSATRAIAGKGLKEVLFATSSLRHSAVHRLPTSAAGILKMLEEAITFTEALNDTRRANNICEIKSELAQTIEGIVQHQTLLERKLSDQLEDLARKREDIDELERLAIEDMLDNDKEHRKSAGSAVEDFLAGRNQASHACFPEKNETQETQNASSESAEDANVVAESTQSTLCGHLENIIR